VLLFLFGYDGMFAVKDGKVIAHVFYQQHGDAYHVFSVWVHENWRMKGVAQTLLQEFICYCGNQTVISTVRLGANKNSAMSRLRARIFEQQGSLESRLGSLVLTFRQGGWIDFKRDMIRIM
jgi:ribosomal protein S18 acetylase RimI-like enzyme